MSDVTDEINALFFASWKAGSSAIVGYIPEIRWQGIQYRDIPDGSKFWCRFSKQTVSEPQATLSNCVTSPGNKRYNNYGLVFIQIFCPKSNAKSFELGKQLAVLARNAFRGKSTDSSIWFRNVRIKELNPEELYERFNVVAEYEFDEIG